MVHAEGLNLPVVGLSSYPVVSESPCWTCRRRRVLCDKRLPSCRKCQQLGQQCLGYKRPLVWNKGLASRGKMMGKTFEQVHTVQAAAVGGNVTLVNARGTRNSADTSPLPPLESISSAVAIRPRTLVDPIIQDLSPVTRYYVDYYARKLCVETVLHDSPGQNPFRELITLIQVSPLILKSILAIAARHATNTDSYPNLLPNWQLFPQKSHGGQLSKTTSPLSSYHALHYKQVALAQLRVDLDQFRRSDHDIIIASISLFVWIEMLESGKDTWRIHLDGLKRLVGSNSSMRDNSPPEAESVLPLNPLIDPYLFDICVICDIMGTTLATPYKITHPMMPTPDVFSYLQRSEKMSFLGCPVDLMYLILVVNWECWSMAQKTTPNPDAQNTTIEQRTLTSHASIVTRIENFEPISWAIKTSVAAPESDLTQRIHLASAYKSAIMIYAVRVLHPYDYPLPSTLIPSLATQIITNLSAIPTHDPFFKCIIWPSFIAGAETHSLEQREIVCGLFQRFWYVLKSANVSNAAQVLGRIWQRADMEGGDEGGDWVHYLADEGVDWLFI